MLKKEDAIEHIKILMITEVLLLVGSNEKENPTTNDHDDIAVCWFVKEQQEGEKNRTSSLPKKPCMVSSCFPSYILASWSIIVLIISVV